MVRVKADGKGILRIVPLSDEGAIAEVNGSTSREVLQMIQRSKNDDSHLLGFQTIGSGMEAVVFKTLSYIPD